MTPATTPKSDVSIIQVPSSSHTNDQPESHVLTLNFLKDLLDVDYDSSTWYDWDERCHGPMDSEENQKSYPEGFQWLCCEKSGKARGCEKDVHRPVNRPAKLVKRAREYIEISD